MVKAFRIFLLSLLAFSFSSENVSAQRNKIRLPIWTFNTDSTTIYGLSVGYTHTDRIQHVISNGIRIEAVGLGFFLPLIPRSPIVNSDTVFREMVFGPVAEKINGINLSPLGHGCDCRVNGINIYGFGSIVNATNGISLGLFGNFSYRSNGIQIGGVGNNSYKANGIQVAFGGNSTEHNMNGIQVGFFGNYAGKAMRGMQIGARNEAGKVRGLQIGLYNKTTDLKGLQIGLWNVNGKRKFPLINW
jgi:hypothetical protein